MIVINTLNNRAVFYSVLLFLLSTLALAFLLFVRPTPRSQQNHIVQSPLVVNQLHVTNGPKMFSPVCPQVAVSKSKLQLVKTPLPPAKTKHLTNSKLSLLLNTAKAPGGQAGSLLPKVNAKVAVEDRLLTSIGSKLLDEQGGFSISPGHDFWRALGEGQNGFGKFLKEIELKRLPLTVEYHLFF